MNETGEVVTLNGGPLDGQQILWPTRELLRFEEHVYMRAPEPGQMTYIGEAQPKIIRKSTEKTNAS